MMRVAKSIALVLCLSLVPLPALANHLVAQENAHMTLPAGGMVRVQLQEQNLDVQVVPGRELRMHTEIWSDSHTLSQKAIAERTPLLHLVGKDIDISAPAIKSQESNWWHILQDGISGHAFGQEPHVQVTLQVPQGAKLDLHLVAGNLHYANPQAQNPLQVQMSAGNAEIQSAAPTLSLNDQAGNVHVSQQDGVQTRIQSQAGNVRWEGVTQHLRVGAQAGNVRVFGGQLPSHSSLTVRAQGGNITVCLPRLSVPVQGEVHTTAGSTRMAYPGFVFGHVNSAGNDAAVQIDLQAQAGDINFYRCEE